VLVNNVRTDPRFIDALHDPTIDAELVVPIIVGERLLGVITVESNRPIDDEEADSIAIIADQFGAALENARRIEGIQQALANTRRLYELSRRIANAMTVDAVVRAYLDAVAARGRYVCTIALYDYDEQDRRVGVLVRGRWSPAEGVQVFNLRVPYAQDALDPPLDAGQTVLIAADEA
jgi:GAF domain-containing protein